MYNNTCIRIRMKINKNKLLLIERTDGHKKIPSGEMKTYDGCLFCWIREHIKARHIDPIISQPYEKIR